MSKNQKIIFAIAVIGTLTCLASSLFSLLRNEQFMTSILFGAAGLFCIGTALRIYKGK